jgi:hypothetical protein
MDFTAGMTERRKQLRRTWQPEASYPYPDSEGNWVIRNRRIVVDQRAHNAERKAPPRDTHKLHMHFYDNVTEISPQTATPLTLGRQSGCDIEVVARHVSCHYAQVEDLNGGFALIDQSTNDTYIGFDDGGQIHVVRDRITLSGTRIISLGKKMLKREPNLIYFWCTTLP